MTKLNHPNIVRLVNAYDEPDQYYLVMELVTGGELFDRICEKECYTELEARDTARILLAALEFMHAKKVVHRDLKPENLLLEVSSIADYSWCLFSSLTCRAATLLLCSEQGK
jgi:calcium/calmodulin-dependent protein kinase I